MRYWFIVHNLKSYKQHPDRIGHSNPDRNFRSIRKDHRIVYYAKPKKLVGIFRVTQDGRKLRRNGYSVHVYGIKPILRPISPIDFEAKDFGVTALRRTTTPLTEEQYGEILSWLLGLSNEAISDVMSHDMVVALFAKMHRDLGYPTIYKVQPLFPDCLAFDEKDQSVSIEFEVKATDFQREKSHRIGGCDRIVCWEDDWGSTAPQGKVLSIKEWLFG